MSRVGEIPFVAELGEAIDSASPARHLRVGAERASGVVH